MNNCVFADNIAGPLGGGAVYLRCGSISVRSSTFVGNATGGLGAAIAGGFTSGPACEGSTFDPVHLDLDLNNSIFWDNQPGTATGSASDHYAWFEGCTDDDLLVVSLSSSYNCVDASSVPSGTGNIIADPRFVDESSRDLRLRRCSPAIGAGDETARPADVEDINDDADDDELHPLDLDLSSRVKGAELDMGAFERELDCEGDLSGDGCVNGFDVAMVLGFWDPTGSLGSGYGAGDANCDGVVDGSDIAIVLGNWGPCPDGSCGEEEEFRGGGSNATPKQAAEMFAFETVDDFAAWLASLDFATMSELLGELFGE